MMPSTLSRDLEASRRGQQNDAIFIALTDDFSRADARLPAVAGSPAHAVSGRCRMQTDACLYD